MLLDLSYTWCSWLQGYRFLRKSWHPNFPKFVGIFTYKIITILLGFLPINHHKYVGIFNYKIIKNYEVTLMRGSRVIRVTVTSR